MFPIDSNGNLTQKTEGSDTWGYEWNAHNELTRVTKNSVEQARFSYDPLGRRVEKVAGGATTGYTYDIEDLIREVRGGTTTKYVHAPGFDEPVATDDGAVLAYLHADALGSIVKVTDGTGVVTSSRRYDAWGNFENGTEQPGYAFTGREWDPEAGLYYYRARYYDPRAGRFISEDPIGFKGGVDFYLYVRNRPASLIDPLGLLEIHPCPGGPKNPQTGNSTAEGAGLCCKGGRYVICTDPSWWSQQPAGFRQCIVEHEEYHTEQMRDDPKPQCGQCTGDPCTFLMPPPGTGKRRECQAWLRTYNCWRDNGTQHPWVSKAREYIIWCAGNGGFF